MHYEYKHFISLGHKMNEIVLLNVHKGYFSIIYNGKVKRTNKLKGW